MNDAENNAGTYSDLYKDLYGIRPSLKAFRAMPLDQQELAIENIAEELAADLEKDAHEEDFDYDIDDYPDRDPYANSSGPDYWQNDAGEWQCG